MRRLQLPGIRPPSLCTMALILVQPFRAWQFKHPQQINATICGEKLPITHPRCLRPSASWRSREILPRARNSARFLVVPPSHSIVAAHSSNISRSRSNRSGRLVDFCDKCDVCDLRDICDKFDKSGSRRESAVCCATAEAR